VLSHNIVSCVVVMVMSVELLLGCYVVSMTRRLPSVPLADRTATTSCTPGRPLATDPTTTGFRRAARSPCRKFCSSRRALTTAASSVSTDHLSGHAEHSMRCLSVCLSVCLSLCLCVCPTGYLRNHTRDLTKFLCMLLMSIARSSSGTLTIGRIAYRKEGVCFPTDNVL